LSDLTAVALGLATGSRTFLAPALLTRNAVVGGLALGELIADKQPDMTARTDARGLMSRTVSAALTGRQAGGARGSLIAVAVALPTAFAASRLRVRLGAGAAGYVEDALAFTIAASVARALSSR
jgi:hypothetical protein